VIDLAMDQNGVLWVITNEGLNRFDGTTWSNVEYWNSIPGFQGGLPQCLFVDADNNLWLGTDGGLSTFNGTSWSQFTNNNSPLSSNDIRVIADDAVGNIWIGTYEGGVYKYVTQTTSLQTNKKKASDLSIYPNPTNGTCTIKFENNQESTRITIYDLAGKLILSKETVESQIQVDKTEIAGEGLFLVTVITPSKTFNGKLLIK